VRRSIITTNAAGAWEDDRAAGKGIAVPNTLRFACAFLVALLAAAPAALAHKAPSGWVYDNFCCGGQDCQPIDNVQVEITPDGYLVSIPQGEHQTARRDHQKLFRYNEVRKSQDENYHACILPNSQEFRCLYVPPFGI